VFPLSAALKKSVDDCRNSQEEWRENKGESGLRRLRKIERVEIY